MADRLVVRRILATFGLGEGVLSEGPVARGRVGEVWRLDTRTGSWAVKTNDDGEDRVGAAATAGFQEAAAQAGVPAPGLRRTVGGPLLAAEGPTTVRVLEWVDLRPPATDLDPVAVGELLASLHRVPDGPWSRGMPAQVHPWYQDPVGATRWDELVRELTTRQAPFAAALAAHRDDLVHLEATFEAPTGLRVCHRDLFADNVRARQDGGLCAFDFDNSGPQSPDHELGFVLVEFATDHRGVADPQRARTLVDAYRGAGGPGRLRGPSSFSMVAAVVGHVAEHAAAAWLAATGDAVRADLAGWVTELTDRPLTPAVVADLLQA